MKKDKGRIYLKILVNFIIYGLGILFIIFVFPKILRFFLPFVIGWIIAWIANPLVRFLEKRVKILRKHSSAIIIIITIAAIIGILYGVVYVIVKELIALSTDIPNIVTMVSLRFEQLVENLSGVIDVLPDSIQEMLSQVVPGIREQVNEFIGSDRISRVPIKFARSFIDWIIMLVIVFLSSYFFIKERDVITKSVEKIAPRTVLEGYNLILYNLKTAIGGYLKAQFKIMIILIVIMFIGFEVIKVPYSLLLASLTGLLDFLPVFGTGAVLWPWALAEVILGNYTKAVSLLIIYLICQVVQNVLQPKMVGDSIGISPLSTLLFMFTGYRIMGVLGMIIFIPIGMVVVSFYRVGMFDQIIKGLKIILNDINEFRKF